MILSFVLLVHLIVTASLNIACVTAMPNGATADSVLLSSPPTQSHPAVTTAKSTHVQLDHLRPRAGSRHYWLVKQHPFILWHRNQEPPFNGVFVLSREVHQEIVSTFATGTIESEDATPKDLISWWFQRQSKPQPNSGLSWDLEVRGGIASFLRTPVTNVKVRGLRMVPLENERRFFVESRIGVILRIAEEQPLVGHVEGSILEAVQAGFASLEEKWASTAVWAKDADTRMMERVHHSILDWENSEALPLVLPVLHDAACIYHDDKGRTGYHVIVIMLSAETSVQLLRSVEQAGQSIETWWSDDKDPVFFYRMRTHIYPNFNIAVDGFQSRAFVRMLATPMHPPHPRVCIELRVEVVISPDAKREDTTRKMVWEGIEGFLKPYVISELEGSTTTQSIYVQAVDNPLIGLTDAEQSTPT